MVCFVFFLGGGECMVKALKLKRLAILSDFSTFGVDNTASLAWINN